MAEFDPSGNPHAIDLPRAESLEQLYQFIVLIREHLNEFTTAWGTKQPDCPRAALWPWLFLCSDSSRIFRIRPQKGKIKGTRTII